jgi:hypothetical protein
MRVLPRMEMLFTIFLARRVVDLGTRRGVAGDRRRTCYRSPSHTCMSILFRNWLATFTDAMLAGVHFRPCASIFGTPSSGLGWTRGETLVDVYALETGLDHRHEATRLPAECRGTTQVS